MAKNAQKTVNPAGFTKDQQDVIKTIREAFAESRGHELRITDQSILDITAKVEGFFEMEDTETQMVFFDKAEEAFKGIAVSDPGISGLVGKMDAEFWREIEVNLEAFIKAKNSMLDTYGSFKRIWSKEQFDAIPYPGSTVESVKGTNYKPDIVVRKNTLGAGEVRTVALDDLIFATPKGKTLTNDITDTRNALKVSGSVKRFVVGGVPLGEMEIKDIQTTATLELNSLKKMFRQAIQLHHKLSAIEGMPRVKISWIPGADKATKGAVIPKKFGGTETFRVTRSGKPFWIVPLDTEGNEIPGKGNSFSVAQVTAFDPSWALAQPDGGTLGDLLASGKPDEPPAGETTADAMSTETLDSTVVSVWKKLSKREDMAALRTRVQAPDNADIREAYCALFLLLKPVYEGNKNWYDELLNGKPDVKAAVAA